MAGEKDQQEGTRRDQKTQFSYSRTRNSTVPQQVSLSAPVFGDSPLLTKTPTYSPLYHLLSELYLALPLF